MNADVVIDIASDMIWSIITSAAPLLLISLAVGLIVSVFQTVTSIQEQTLTFVPKILCVFLGIMLFGSWIMGNIVEYAEELWSNFSVYIG
jgi:flagellar biosynthetic protein FliQ